VDCAQRGEAAGAIAEVSKRLAGLTPLSLQLDIGEGDCRADIPDRGGECGRA
jgi:hypothetical protein